MIKKATIEDLSQLARLFDLYRQFYAQKSDIEAAELFLKERLAKKESVIFTASPENEVNKLVGFVQLYPTFSSIGLKNSWILNDLFVDPGYRASGFGEELMKTATAFSKDTGARSLMLQTGTSNVSAQKLYEKLGWLRDEKFFAYYYFH